MPDKQRNRSGIRLRRDGWHYRPGGWVCRISRQADSENERRHDERCKATGFGVSLHDLYSLKCGPRKAHSCGAFAHVMRPARVLWEERFVTIGYPRAEFS